MSSHTQSWEGEEKQELKEVVSEPTTPPLPTDDDKPNPVSLAPLLAVVGSFRHHMTVYYVYTYIYMYLVEYMFISDR